MPRTKIMRVEEGKKVKIDDHPNFHKSGSIKGMKASYYGENALLVKCGNYIYRVPKRIYDQAH